MSHRFIIQYITVVLAAIFASSQIASAQVSAARRDAAEYRRLSSAALEPLVAGIALFPDPLVKDILNAATMPQAMQELGGTNQTSDSSQAGLPASINALQAYTELVVQLRQHWLLTVRLGVAYRQQPADVWAAIEHVRTSVDSLVPQPSTSSDESNLSPTVVYANSVSVVMSRLLSPATIAELQTAVAAGRETRLANSPASGDVIKRDPSKSRASSAGQIPSSGARYSQMSPQQIALANEAMLQSWSQLEIQLAAKRPTLQTPDRLRPSAPAPR